MESATNQISRHIVNAGTAHSATWKAFFVTVAIIIIVLAFALTDSYRTPKYSTQFSNEVQNIVSKAKRAESIAKSSADKVNSLVSVSVAYGSLETLRTLAPTKDINKASKVQTDALRAQLQQTIASLQKSIAMPLTITKQ